jgi:hypothetical protein
MLRPTLNLDVPDGTETLLVKSDYRPYFRSIIAITLSFLIVELFVKGHLLYSQLSEPSPDQKIISYLTWSIVGDAFSIFAQLLCWAVGIVTVRNSTRLLKFITPAIFFSIGGVVSTIVFQYLIFATTQPNDKFEILGFVSVTMLALNVLVVLLAKLMGFIGNKIAPYIVSLMIVSFLHRLYTPELGFFVTSTLSKMRLDYYLLQLACSMVILTLFNIPLYDDRPEQQSVLKRLKSLITLKVKTPDLTRKQIFDEIASAHPTITQERIARIFATVPYPDDIAESKVRSALIIFVILLSCFSNYLAANWNQFGFWIVIVKVLLIYFLLRPTPYVYAFLVLIQLITLGILAFDLIEFIRYSSAYSYYGMDKFRTLLFWTAGKFVASLAFALLVWNVLRFRYPNFRLFKPARDADGNLLA